MAAVARTLLRLLGRVPIALLLLVVVAAGCRDAAAQAVSYRVIVNAQNPVAQLKRDDLSRLFLKKVVTWKTGAEVQPVDQAQDSPVRRSFTKDVHKKDVEQVKGYWQQLIFTGQGAPPIEKGSDDEVVAFVAKTPAAIGYVSSTAALGSGVKTVQILP